MNQSKGSRMKTRCPKITSRRVKLRRRNLPKMEDNKLRRLKRETAKRKRKLQNLSLMKKSCQFSIENSKIFEEEKVRNRTEDLDKNQSRIFAIDISLRKSVDELSPRTLEKNSRINSSSVEKIFTQTKQRKWPYLISKSKKHLEQVLTDKVINGEIFALKKLLKKNDGRTKSFRDNKRNATADNPYRVYKGRFRPKKRLEIDDGQIEQIMKSSEFKDFYVKDLLCHPKVNSEENGYFKFLRRKFRRQIRIKKSRSVCNQNINICDSSVINLPCNQSFVSRESKKNF